MKKSRKILLSVFGISIPALLIAGYFYVSSSAASPLDQLDASAVSNFFNQKRSEGMLEKKIFGYSENGRAIYGYETGAGKNALLLIAGMHGREKGGKDLLDKLAEEVLSDPSLISPTNKLIIIPLVNPDGYYGGQDKVNANGVNLNRNFGTSQWVQYEGEDLFAGAKPFSESESRVIKDLVEQFQPRMMIAFHSQGHIVSPEAGDPSIKLARWYAGKTGYHYFDEWDYAGTATRWFQELTDNPAITVELINHVESDWEINKAALFELIS